MVKMTKNVVEILVLKINQIQRRKTTHGKSNDTWEPV